MNSCYVVTYKGIILNINEEKIWSSNVKHGTNTEQDFLTNVRITTKTLQEICRISNVKTNIGLSLFVVDRSFVEKNQRSN